LISAVVLKTAYRNEKDAMQVVHHLSIGFAIIFPHSVHDPS
jgi:hypothetical protein